MLLRESITDEDQIISTLVFAHEMDRPRPTKGEELSPEVLEPLFPPAYETVRTVDEVDIVERDPVSALIYNPT